MPFYLLCFTILFTTHRLISFLAISNQYALVRCVLVFFSSFLLWIFCSMVFFFVVFFATFFFMCHFIGWESRTDRYTYLFYLLNRFSVYCYLSPMVYRDMCKPRASVGACIWRCMYLCALCEYIFIGTISLLLPFLSYIVSIVTTKTTTRKQTTITNN